MEQITQFIEKHTPQMDKPEKVYDLFAGLSYETVGFIKSWPVSEEPFVGLSFQFSIKLASIFRKMWPKVAGFQ